MGSKYEYFSSYGLDAEAEIHITHEGGKLLKLLKNNYIRNKTQLQPLQDSNTCARWALARSFLIDVSLGDFVRLFTRKITIQSADDLVTLATIFALR